MALTRMLTNLHSRECIVSYCVLLSTCYHVYQRDSSSSREGKFCWSDFISLFTIRLLSDDSHATVMARPMPTSSMSWLFSIFAVALLLTPINALYFYMDGTAQKCFYEELPKDTLVVGTQRLHHTWMPPANQGDFVDSFKKDHIKQKPLTPLLKPSTRLLIFLFSSQSTRHLTMITAS